MADPLGTLHGAQSVSRISVRLPLWLRTALVVGLAVLAAGAGLFGYKYYTRPVTLTVAVGSIDGEAAKVMSAIASTTLAECVCATVFQGFVFGSADTAEAAP
jgi:hypothetical protein